MENTKGVFERIGTWSKYIFHWTKIIRMCKIKQGKQ
jgi:hypothetical protein